MDAFNVVVGLAGFIGVIFSFWIWMSSRFKVHEITKAIEVIRDISGTAIWENQSAYFENDTKRLEHAEKILTSLNAIHKITAKYADDNKNQFGGGSSQLIEQGIIITQAIVMQIEMSKNVTEIWLVTSDLRPDSSDVEVGRSINKNIKDGKRYVY